MTLDEKLNNFYDSAINDANTKSSKIINEYKDSLDKIFEEHKQNAMRKSALELRIQKENYQREKNKALSNETLMIKRNLNEKASILEEELFKDVLKKIKEFISTKEYFDLLTNQILHAVDFAREDDITIYIDPADASKQSELELITGVTLNISTYSFIGGIRAVIQAKNILIDNSFATKLEEVQEHFTLETVLKTPVKCKQK